MQSGVKTVGIPEIIWQVVFASAMTARVDSFLCSSVNISLPKNMGDLLIEM
jgi:hypothetical protein